MPKENDYVQLGQAKKKNETAKGCWVECTVYPSEEKKDVFFPFSHLRVEGEEDIWVSDWILSTKEKELLDDDEGFLIE